MRRNYPYSLTIRDLLWITVVVVLIVVVAALWVL